VSGGNVINPKEQAEYEQSTAFLGEMLPGMWRRLYEGCKEKGFSEMESFKLVQTYIISQGSGNKVAPE
jgi:hypothetical protein